MNEPPIRIDVEGSSDEDYDLEPSPPVQAQEIFPKQSADIEEALSKPDPVAKPRFQYSLADIFALTACVAAFTSLLVTISSSLALGGVMAVGALGSLIMLVCWPREQLLLKLGWWVMFALFLLGCIGAMIFSK
jgi:hypothetical protein